MLAQSPDHLTGYSALYAFRIYNNSDSFQTIYTDFRKYKIISHVWCRHIDENMTADNAMNQENIMTLTIHEAAERLELPVNTLERWIRQGRIPVIKTYGRTAAFNMPTLQKWAQDHHISFLSSPITCSATVKTRRMDTLGKAMQSGGVYYRLEGNDTASVLKSAVNQVAGISEPDRDTLYEKLIEREHLSSTGIGNGVSIPHPRSPLHCMTNRSEILTFFLEHPVDFHAIDDKPVFVMFLILCDSTASHLQLLSRLAFCLRDKSFIQFLKTSPDSDTLFHKIAEFEEHLDQPNP